MNDHMNTSTNVSDEAEEWGDVSPAGCGTEAPIANRGSVGSVENWLVLNAADQIVEVGQLLRQQVRTLDYVTPDLLTDGRT
ncbi:hypothetical protein [Natronoglycomyces albus]|uniref:Uncharacterized protein n=1 Tax=Natronoglycomyces albus TaxID=2811108 RepID=A0A895XS73_9ACTN|nr:hypothetical protein [Natronoglycomyces albus]QSB05406.1 hypothetical protein JQS30_00205 [Natronoglycomyces albus]